MRKITFQFQAMIWQEGTAHGERVIIEAKNTDEAKEKLEKKYGVGKVFDIHNHEEANRVR